MVEQENQVTTFRAFDLIPDPVIVADAHRVIRYANEQVHQAFGYCSEELAGRSLRYLGLMGTAAFPDSAGSLKATRVSVRATDGRHVPVDLRCNRTSQGTHVCVLRPVRARVADSRSDIGGQYSMLEPLTEGVLIVDADASVSYANPPALQILGYDEVKLRNLNVRDLFSGSLPGSRNHPASASHFVDVALVERRPVRNVESVIVRADGSRGDVTLNVVPIEESGELNAAIVSLRDITRERRTELQMAAQKQVLESVADGRDLGEISEIVVEFLEQAIPGTRVALCGINQSAQTVETIAAPRLTDVLRDAIIGTTEDERTPFALQVLGTGQPLIVQSLSEPAISGELSATLLQEEVGALWCYPVVSAASSSIRVLCVLRDQPGRPAPSDQALIDSATSLARIALDLTQPRPEARTQSFNDEVTGLPNRVLMLDRLDLALQRAATSDHQVVLFLVSIDQYQMVINSLGYQAADQLLHESAARLRNCLRSGDFVARFTSDGFGIVLEKISSREDAVNVVMRIQRAFAVPFDLSGVEIYGSASIGLALSTGEETDTDALVRYADIALHRARGQGQGQFAIFSPAQDLTRVPKIALQSRLHRALAADALELHYQPLVSLQDFKVTGYEALVRWHDEHFGNVAPDEFLPLAQQSGIMSEITAWVLDRAVSQALNWQTLIGRPITVGVNVSPGELNDPLLVEQVAAVLKRYQLDPSNLVLEMTEHALVDISGRTSQILERLRELGVSITLDDFGTGFSSLSYLERLPVDGIKIDRSFIQSARGGASRAPVAEAMVDLARNLGMETVAEGVETEEDERVARRLGCDLSQGYFYGRPQPADQLSPAQLFLPDRH